MRLRRKRRKLLLFVDRLIIYKYMCSDKCSFEVRITSHEMTASRANPQRLHTPLCSSHLYMLRKHDLLAPSISCKYNYNRVTQQFTPPDFCRILIIPIYLSLPFPAQTGHSRLRSGQRTTQRPCETPTASGSSLPTQRDAFVAHRHKQRNFAQSQVPKHAIQI